MSMPAIRSGKAHKLMRPYHGLYLVITTSDSTVAVCPVDWPNASSIHVTLDCNRVSPAERLDVFWSRRTCPNTETTDTAEDMVPQTEWTGCLRSRPSWDRDVCPDAQEGEL